MHFQINVYPGAGIIQAQRGRVVVCRWLGVSFGKAEKPPDHGKHE
jgi:hypothetical protein